MHVHYLDPYRHRGSPIHRLDPRLKFVLSLAFILTAALVPEGAWPAYVLLLSLVFALAVLSELGIAYVLQRSALALPFMLAAVPILFTSEGQVVAHLALGGWTLSISEPGLIRFLSIALKSWISVQVAVILAASTPFPALLSAMRAVKVPRLLVAIFGLMWRYLFVLGDEALRLLRARSARSAHSDQTGLRPGGSLAWRARVAGGMAGSLFLRAFDRSDRIYMAMTARGYDGEVRSLPLPALKAGHWVVLGSFLGVLAVVLGLALLFWS
jgi:cobalt/nickel transport system permease protein